MLRGCRRSTTLLVNVADRSFPTKRAARGNESGLLLQRTVPFASRRQWQLLLSGVWRERFRLPLPLFYAPLRGRRTHRKVASTRPPAIQNITSGPNIKNHKVSVSAFPAINVCARPLGVINFADLQHVSCCCSALIGSEAMLDSNLRHMP